MVRAEQSDGARRVLDVWASWERARLAGAECPTLAACWDRHESDGNLWVHEQTQEIRAAIECPRGPWRLVQVWVAPKSGALWLGLQPGPRWQLADDVVRRPTMTRRLENPVRTIGLAVDDLLARDEMFAAHPLWRSLLLGLYPRSGVYEVGARSYDVRAPRRHERHLAAAVLSADRRAVWLVRGHGLQVGGRLAA